MTTLFPTDRFTVLGVVHLEPLPTSPGFRGDRRAIFAAAARDAEAILEGGADGFIVENFGDAPFRKNRVDPAVVAELTAITVRLGTLVASSYPDAKIGINVLRNDAAAALSVAAAAGASFIRVNVHTGAMFSDQGLIEGRADETLRLRRTLESDVAIVADVAVKHAVPPQGFRLADAARDCAYRGGADGLIVTGPATGAAANLDDLHTVGEAVPDRPLFVGSGVTAETLPDILELAHGIVVGTGIKQDGRAERPVDVARVRELVTIARR